MKALLVLTVLLASNAFAAVRYVNELLEKASPKEAKEIKALIKKMDALPTMKDPYANAQSFEVTDVKPGSVYEKEGVKVGDIIVNGSRPDTIIPIEL